MARKVVAKKAVKSTRGVEKKEEVKVEPVVTSVVEPVVEKVKKSVKTKVEKVKKVEPVKTKSNASSFEDFLNDLDKSGTTVEGIMKKIEEFKKEGK